MYCFIFFSIASSPSFSSFHSRPPSPILLLLYPSSLILLLLLLLLFLLLVLLKMQAKRSLPDFNEPPVTMEVVTLVPREGKWSLSISCLTTASSCWHLSHSSDGEQNTTRNNSVPVFMLFRRITKSSTVFPIGDKWCVAQLKSIWSGRVGSRGGIKIEFRSYFSLWIPVSEIACWYLRRTKRKKGKWGGDEKGEREFLKRKSEIGEKQKFV